MADAFDKLKQTEQIIVSKETGWIKANRQRLIVGAVAALVLAAVILCIVKMF